MQKKREREAHDKVEGKREREREREEGVKERGKEAPNMHICVSSTNKVVCNLL